MKKIFLQVKITNFGEKNVKKIFFPALSKNVTQLFLVPNTQ